MKGNPLMANRTKFTNHTREKFLTVLRMSANVSEACRACGVSRHGAYDVRDADPEFARAWEEAVSTATDALEREAWRRAVEGFEEPIHYQGAVVGYVKKYSDRMLELLLKAHRPEKYRESGASVLINNHQQNAEIAVVAPPVLSPAAASMLEEARRLVMLEHESGDRNDAVALAPPAATAALPMMPRQEVPDANRAARHFGLDIGAPRREPEAGDR
jgi:hypothetical protein